MRTGGMVDAIISLTFLHQKLPLLQEARSFENLQHAPPPALQYGGRYGVVRTVQWGSPLCCGVRIRTDSIGTYSVLVQDEGTIHYGVSVLRTMQVLQQTPRRSTCGRAVIISEISPGGLPLLDPPGPLQKLP